MLRIFLPRELREWLFVVFCLIHLSVLGLLALHHIFLFDFFQTLFFPVSEVRIEALSASIVQDFLQSSDSGPLNQRKRFTGYSLEAYVLLICG